MTDWDDDLLTPLQTPEKAREARVKALVDEASQAFGSDFRYAEEMARAFHNLRRLKAERAAKNRLR